MKEIKILSVHINNDGIVVYYNVSEDANLTVRVYDSVENLTYKVDLFCKANVDHWISAFSNNEMIGGYVMFYENDIVIGKFKIEIILKRLI